MTVRRVGPKRSKTGNYLPKNGGPRKPPRASIEARKLRAGYDTPVRLLRDIAEKRLDASSLSKQQRRACLVVLANGKQTQIELGELFGVSHRTIRMDLRQIRKELGREVREWGLDEVLGQTVMAAEKYQTLAIKHEDPALAWSIQRDLVKLLRDLGVVGRDQDRDGLRITVEAIGSGYERARKVLGQALDPRLTGLEPSKQIEGLPLARRIPGDQARGAVVDAVVVSSEEEVEGEDLAVPQVRSGDLTPDRPETTS